MRDHLLRNHYKNLDFREQLGPVTLESFYWNVVGFPVCRWATSISEMNPRWILRFTFETPLSKQKLQYTSTKNDGINSLWEKNRDELAQIETNSRFFEFISFGLRIWIDDTFRMIICICSNQLDRNESARYFHQRCMSAHQYPSAPESTALGLKFA